MAIKRLYDTIVGATVNVNQLMENGDFPDNSWDCYRGTATYSDGVISVTGATARGGIRQKEPYNTNVETGHIFFWSCYMSATVTMELNIVQSPRIIISDVSSTMKYYSGIVRKTGTSTTVRADIFPTNTDDTGDFSLKKLRLTDLTAKFGTAIADYLYNLESATAGAGIAKLREWGFITGEYIPHNPGSLESVEARSHVMRGFNCWNSEADNLRKNIGADGNLVNNNTYATSDYIPVLPNTTYYAKNVGPSSNVRTCFFYDSDKNPLSYFSISGASGVPVSGSIPTTDKTRYVRLVRFIDQTEFCFSLSSSRNGEYEPYSAHTYDLGTDTLRGLFKLDSNNNLYADGDTKTSDGAITRKYGVVDLGTLGWNYSQGSYNEFWTTVSGITTASENVNMMCSRYKVKDWHPSISDIPCIYKPANDRIYVMDSAYTDAASFKTAMSGVYLVYELATPTTEQSTPFTNPQICDPDGTEEYVTSNGVPVGHETRYQL